MTATETPGVVVASCPGRDFGAFLAAFAEQPAVQRQFTAYPLAYVTVEDGPNGPAPHERRVPLDSVSEPLFLSAAIRARDSLEVRIDSSAANQRVVLLAKPGTDYQLEYTFEHRPDGCWQLTRYDNQSL